MNKKIIFITLTSLLSCVCFFELYSWGFFAHQRINRMAVFLLPPEMFGFYKHHIDYLTAHAVDPDKRRYAVEGEAACHYIDIDRYGEQPFDSIPRKWKDAVNKYSEDTLMEHGIVPWHIEKVMYRLTNAFKEKNFRLILKYSADIGHYIGDSHVPLHCTQNYNGQLTNQHGIHGFWESRIPELFADDYDYILDSCKYIDSPLDEAWEIIKASYTAHDSVLYIEKMLSIEFPADKKYAIEQKGQTSVKVYSYEYTKAYSHKLNGMVERRMRESILKVASYWYTAWVNAGQPVLNDLENKTIFVDDSLQTDSINNTIIKTTIKGHTD